MSDPILFGEHVYGQFDKEWVIKALYPHFDLFFVHEGIADLRIAGKKERMEAPQAILIYPHTAFKGDIRTSLGMGSVQHFDIVDPDAPLPACLNRIARCTHGYELYTMSASHAAERDVRRALQLGRDGKLSDIFDRRIAILTLILAELQSPEPDAPKPSAQDPEFGSVITFMNENLHKKISLDDMSALIGMSTSHFRSLFRKRFAVSPGAFLLKLKMEHAAYLLLESSMPIKRIARDVGYPQLSHFYHTFSSYHGRPPADYRRENSTG